MGKLSRAVIRQNLLVLVKEKPEIKKNRNMMITEYWKKFNGAVVFEDSCLCTSAESITREFRRLVEAGLVILDAKSKQELAAKAEEYKQAAYEEQLAFFKEFDEPILVAVGR
jgi:hypothetical protein